MVILGLDVSTTRTGWAIINDKQELVDSDLHQYSTRDVEDVSY